jgi:hypothetical protein
MSNAPRFPVATHWSKDFVEHLRTVHFSLITVSVALILFAYAHKDVDFPSAFAQAQQMFQLREKWEKVQANIYKSTVRANKFPDHEYVFLFVNSPFIPKKSIIGKLDIKEEEFAKYLPWKLSNELGDPPLTFADFRDSWNRLHKGLTVVVPIFKGIREPSHGCNVDIWWRLDDGRVDPTVTKTIYGHDDEDPDRLSGFLEPDRSDGSCEIGMIPITIPETTNIGSIEWEPPYRGTDNKDYILLKGEIDVPVTGMVLRGHNVKREELHFQRLYDLKFASTNELPLAAMFRESHKGEFNEAFPELALISNDLLKIDLKDVPDRVRYMEVQGEQGVDAFGLRVTASEVGRFGVVLLLAVQLYFWLHLRELAGKIAPSAPGWDVAWIGVYSSRPSVVALFLSSCVLPLASAIVIVPRIWHASGQDSPVPPPLLRLLVAGTVYLLSGGLAAATIARINRLRKGREVAHEEPVSEVQRDKEVGERV